MGTKIASGAGLKHVRFWVLDSSGYPDGDQSGATGYDGVRLEGAKSFDSNVPEPEFVTHRGDDRTIAQDSLGATEFERATLTTAKTNLDADAALTDTLVHQLAATIEMGGMGTDKSGSEKDVAIWGWRQALDTTKDGASFGNRRYITNLYSKARVIPLGGPMPEGGDDVNSYSVVPTATTKPPWGLAFASGTNDFTESTRLRLVSSFPLMMERWTGNGTLDEFNLVATPIATANQLAWGDGATLTVSAVNTSTDTMTLSAPPANLVKIVSLYETSDALS